MLSKNREIKKSKWFSLFACLSISACGGGDQSGRNSIGVMEQPQTAPIEAAAPEKITRITAGGVDYSLSSRSKIWVVPRFPDLKIANEEMSLEKMAAKIVLVPKDLNFKMQSTMPRSESDSNNTVIHLGEMNIAAPEPGLMLQNFTPIVGRLVANIEVQDFEGSDPCRSTPTTTTVYSEDSVPVVAHVTKSNSVEKTFTVSLSAQIPEEFLQQYKTKHVVLGRKTQAIGCRNYCSKVSVVSIPKMSQDGLRTIRYFSGAYNCTPTGRCGHCAFGSDDCFSINELKSTDQCISQSVAVTEQKAVEITEEIRDWSVRLDQLDRAFGWTLNGFSDSAAVQVLPGISQIDRAEIKLPLSSVGL